jgi:hypothetical protein
LILQKLQPHQCALFRRNSRTGPPTSPETGVLVIFDISGGALAGTAFLPGQRRAYESPQAPDASPHRSSSTEPELNTFALPTSGLLCIALRRRTRPTNPGNESANDR